MKVLLGVDDSAYSEAAVQHVLSGAFPAGTRFLVVSAAAPIFAGPGEVSSPDAVAKVMEAQAQCHREIANRAAERLRKAGLAADARTVVADPRSALVEIAHSEGINLVVVGSQGKTGLKKLLLGSVASHVVTHAPCSVLVVRGAAGSK